MKCDHPQGAAVTFHDGSVRCLRCRTDLKKAEEKKQEYIEVIPTECNIPYYKCETTLLNSIDDVRDKEFKLSRREGDRLAVITRTIIEIGELKRDVIHGVQYWTAKMIVNKRNQNTDGTWSEFVEYL